jgi:hypothetical protein
MLTRSARSRGFGGRVGDAILGSWTRTVAVVAVALVIFGIIGFLAATGRLGDLRHANIPLVHPYPPVGFYQNSFNPTDRGDLINTATAAKVSSDLLADGQIELQAVRTGDGSHLADADTGNNLTRIRSVLARNAADGVTEDFTNHITKITVGRLADPNDTSVTTVVEEVGTSRVTYTRTSDGSVAKEELVKFVDRFWLVERSGRYLITDVQVSSQVVGQ